MNVHRIGCTPKQQRIILLAGSFYNKRVLDSGGGDMKVLFYFHLKLVNMMLKKKVIHIRRLLTHRSKIGIALDGRFQLITQRRAQRPQLGKLVGI